MFNRKILLITCRHLEAIVFLYRAYFLTNYFFCLRNSVVNFMLDGTSIKQAVEKGRSGGNCGATYARCPFTKDSLFAAVRSLMTDQQ
jgi:hypothetical protein